MYWKKFLAPMVLVLAAMFVTQAHAAPGSKLATYTAKDGSWSIAYRADVLHVEQRNGVTIFIGKNRSTFMAVDSFIAKGDMYGNTGEDLRNRAQDVLELVYNKPVTVDEVLEPTDTRWATGLRFSTDKGSAGQALYAQNGRAQGNYRVAGLVYGYKAASESTAKPMLEQMRDSFKYMPPKPTSADLPQAKAALKSYLEALSGGRYDQASRFYGGDLTQLRNMFPESQDQASSLLEAACTGGFRCMKVRSIDKGQMGKNGRFSFTVQFTAQDGKLYVFTPPPGSPEKARSNFVFSVRKVGDVFLVDTLPPYEA